MVKQMSARELLKYKNLPQISTKSKSYKITKIGNLKSRVWLLTELILFKKVRQNDAPLYHEFEKNSTIDMN